MRELFLTMFQTYDVFTLPMPHADPSILKKLGTLPRDQLSRPFATKLWILIENILLNAKPKVLFSKDHNGKDQYVVCSGSRM